MKPLELASHKKKFLESIGFRQTYNSDKPNEYKGELHTMEKWERHTSYMSYILYIHFSDKESNYCNLYYDTKSDDADVFSERNLISEIKKRGLEESE